MMKYEELLIYSKKRFDEFFKNVPIFENQFRFSYFNFQCYREMYENNSYEQIKTVKELKESIPDLKETCKKCGNFFIPQRNKSIPKYDVILGKQHEEVLMEFLEKELGTSVVRGDLENRSYPDCKVLDKNGNTVAYFEVKFHGAPFVSSLQLTGRYCYEGSATLDHKKIEKQLEIIKNEIDVPVFYVHWLAYPCLKGIFYETSGQVEEYINMKHVEFERKKREGDDLKNKSAIYLKKMYSPLLKLDDFDSFINKLKSLL